MLLLDVCPRLATDSTCVCSQCCQDLQQVSRFVTSTMILVLTHASTACCWVSPWQELRESRSTLQPVSILTLPFPSEAMLLGASLGISPELLAGILNTSVRPYLTPHQLRATDILPCRRLESAGPQRSTTLRPAPFPRSLLPQTENTLAGAFVPSFPTNVTHGPSSDSSQN